MRYLTYSGNNLIDVELPDGSTEELDLGDIAVRVATLAVSGTVVDDLGRPAVGAFVQMRDWSRGPEDEAWRQWARDAVDQDSDGSFRFVDCGAEPEVQLDAMAQVDGWPAWATARVPRGTEGLRLVLASSGAVAPSDTRIIMRATSMSSSGTKIISAP